MPTKVARRGMKASVVDTVGQLAVVGSCDR